MRTFIAIFFLLLATSPAQARWLEASSDNFVVYADDTPANVQQFSQRLERFHATLALLTSASNTKPSPSNRVTIYVVDTQRAVQKLAGRGSRYLNGYYRPMAGNAFAVIPQVKAGSGTKLNMSMITLLHEYVHHYTTLNSSFPPPRWMSEGMAEFFASASFGKDGSVTVGMPANHRGAELLYAKDVSIEELLDPQLYEQRATRQYDSFYGRSWLLYHHLTMGKGRDGQMAAYIKALASGKAALEAGTEAFGDLKVLEQELDANLKRRRFNGFVVAANRTTPSAIAMRELSAGEAAMMPVRIESRTGVTEEEAAALVEEARKVAARFPDDPPVQAALAEAEFDAGNHDAAIAAADKALAVDARQINAYVQKGYALFAKADKAADREAAYKAARQPFLALNKIENDHPLPLIYFFRSFAEQGEEPGNTARLGLERAAQLAPFDLGLRMNVARMQMAEGRKRAARNNLVPIAYSPHSEQLGEVARSMIEAIDRELASKPPR